MARLDRPKASKVFNEANFVFASKGPFEEAFPQIDSVDVDAAEGGYGPTTRAYWSGGEYVDCSNSLCYNGGVSIGRMLRTMVADGLTQSTFNELCQGNEASPKGRKVYRKCLHHFEVRITVTYKDPVGDDGPSSSPGRPRVRS
jgi:hypothetical protein